MTPCALIATTTGESRAIDFWEYDVIVVGERQLLRLVREHARYYNEDRPHMSLAGDAPVRRVVEPPALGRVVALPRVGGLDHR